MSQKSRTILKAFFETGDVPTEAQFIDLIDSFLSLLDDDTDDITESATKEFLDSSAEQEISGAKEFSNAAYANNSASVIISFSATPTFDLSNGNDWEMPITGNVTSFATSNSVGSCNYKIWLINDATPGRTVVAPTGWTKTASSDDHVDDADAINLYQFFTRPGGEKYYSILNI